MAAMSAGTSVKGGRCWRLLVSALLWSASGTQAGRLPRETQRQDKLIGWSERYVTGQQGRKGAAKMQRLSSDHQWLDHSYSTNKGNTTISNPLRNSWVETLSWQPRVFL